MRSSPGFVHKEQHFKYYWCIPQNVRKKARFNLRVLTSSCVYLANAFPCVFVYGTLTTRLKSPQIIKKEHCYTININNAATITS